eukprot:gb/GFBE01064712.1/.p1 GENE.gb/GFBE01064712.1/~~gb/GFBE01064712.1/.p1  ORF type:complete len:619 (+),score=183.64 gb/GFBE01064712.1/:1-1857(+)
MASPMGSGMTGALSAPLASTAFLQVNPVRAPHHDFSVSRTGHLVSHEVAGAAPQESRSAFGAVSVAAAASMLCRARRCRRAALRQRHRPGKVIVAASKQVALEQQMIEPTKEELRALFEEAAEGRDVITFDEAISLDGVDGVLEEGAATEDELEVIWGDADGTLNFEGFCRWYKDVLKVYDEFLWQDAVAPPDEVMDDDDKEDLRNLSDEQLLEDAPAMGVQVKNLKTPRVKPVGEMKYGTLSGDFPPVERSLLLEADDRPEPELEDEDDFEDDKFAATEGMAAPAAGGGRQNVEITKLFRQACNEDNLLSFEALQKISEFKSLIEDGDMTEDELEDMWDEMPKKGDCIDVLAFRDLLAKVDELFEYVEEDEEEDPAAKAMVQSGERGLANPNKREMKTVKEELMAAIERYEAELTRPCGMDGREELDGELVKLAGELEDVWRDSAGNLNDFDASTLSGDWEMIFTTSGKMRRWGGVLNNGREVKGVWEALVQNFAVSDEEDYNEYDMEEVYTCAGASIDDPEIELSMRGQGSWKVGIQQNVVTGEEDLVLKMDITGVEYDTPEDRPEICGEKTLMSQMVRTFSYMFLSYMDDDIRVMRTSLTGKSLYIFQRIKEDED